MKRLSIIIVLIFIGISKSFSQSNVYVQGLNYIGEFTISSSSRSGMPFTKGSPYYNRDFMFGEMELHNGGKLKGLFRYNIYNQEFEVIVKRDTLIISDPTKVKSIEFSGKSFVYSLILEKKHKTTYLSGAYFQRLNDGNCKLLIKRKINLRENKFVDYYGGGGGDGTMRYIPEETYYIKTSDDAPAIKFKRKKKVLYSIFPDKASEIEDYIEKQEIKISDDDDLIRVINYINKLNQK